MIIINYFTKEDILDCKVNRIESDLTITEWIVEKYYGTSIAYSIFDGVPSNESDITLRILSGENVICEEYTVLETPSAELGVAAWLAIVSVVISVAAIALAPKPKIPDTVSRSQESPNNQLGARSNRARPLQRIPDIKGTVKSIPDIIMPTYFKYQDLRTRVEHGYYCVGRKQLSLAEINDGDTPIALMEGASAQVYYPNKSPNNSSPDIQIGEFIDLPIVTPFRSNEVDGADLPAEQEVGSTPIIVNSLFSDNPSETSILASTAGITPPGKMRLLYIRASAGDWISPDYYIGNSIILENFLIQDIILPSQPIYDISGTYVITDISFGSGGVHTIDVDFDYSSMPQGYAGAAKIGGQSTTKFSTPYNQWFYISNDEYDKGFVNISAPNGLYRDTGGASPLAITIDYEVEVEPTDIDGIPSGSSQIIPASLSGNSNIKRGLTVEFDLPYSTRFRARVRRTTARITLSGTIQDDTKFEDLYALKNVGLDHFGDITTIQTRTIATPFATSTKDRQLNCIATEMLYMYEGSGIFSDTLTTNESAIQSYISDFIDPKIGNRPIEELDADGLLSLESEIVSYFGGSEYAEFNFTLDSTDITFQEYTQMLFNAIYCVAYRDGSIVKAHFERQNSMPSMLFTHRSKIPQTETYSRNFNFSQLHDGVEFKWIDPETNTQEVIYLPDDKNYTNPKKFEMAGFRNYNQSYKRALREYAKILNEKIHVDLEVTAEGRYIKPGDVISIVKGTRTNTSDGEILDVSLDGYTLTLSQDVNFINGDAHSIIIKKDDGSVESILCTVGAQSNQVVLLSLPDEAVRTGIESQRRTEFSFGNDDRINAQLFIARTIDVSNKHTVQVKAVNYTDLYYAGDNESLNAFDGGFDEGFS